MIIVPNCSGRLCNRLVYFTHSLATALDCGHNMIYLFGEDILSFSDLNVDSLPGIRVDVFNWPRSKIIDGVCGFLEWHCHPDRVGYKTRCPDLIKQFHARPHVLPIFLWDWAFRNHDGVKRHCARIRSYLRAKDAFIARAKDIVARVRENAEVVVGVHIRRGDYKWAYDGKYHYSDNDYLCRLKDFERSAGRKTCFIIVSNEPVNCEFFSSNGVSVVNASASAPEDVVTLSECDYIMGPPSTFSGFASYYGNKPICRILDREQRIEIGAFKVLECL